MLIDDGLHDHEGDGQWGATGEREQVAVPPSIQALLAARVDRLTPEERTVLEAAAVVGQAFFVGAVMDLVPRAPRDRVPVGSLGARAEGADPTGAFDAGGRGRFPIPAPLHPRLCVRGDPEGDDGPYFHERFADWLERRAGDAVASRRRSSDTTSSRHYVYLNGARSCRRGDRTRSADERRRPTGDRPGDERSDRSDFVGAANLLRRSPRSGRSDRAERAATLYHLGIALGQVDDFSGTLGRVRRGDRTRPGVR